MRQSRYVWLLGISLFCLITIIVFKTPQTVISTLADPQYGRFSAYNNSTFLEIMDLRQTDLARDLLSITGGIFGRN